MILHVTDFHREMADKALSMPDVVHRDLSDLQRKYVLRWIEALENDEYRQGDGFLRMTVLNEPVDRFCCLGVAADLVDPVPWVAHGSMLDMAHQGYGYGEAPGNWLPTVCEHGSMQECVAEVCKTSSRFYVGSVWEQDYGLTPNGMTTLGKLNDTQIGFPIIASVLRNWYGLPKTEV